MNEIINNKEINNEVIDPFEISKKFLFPLIREKQQKKNFFLKSSFTIFETAQIRYGSLITIGDRTATGKTTLAINLMLDLLKNNPEDKAAFFSLEMDKVQIIEKNTF